MIIDKDRALKLITYCRMKVDLEDVAKVPEVETNEEELCRLVAYLDWRLRSEDMLTEVLSKSLQEIGYIDSVSKYWQ